MTVKDGDGVFEKHCVLNYHRIQDPFDVDGDGLTTAAFSQWTSEQLIVLDAWCLLAGTDTNFPSTNQFGITADKMEYAQEVADTRRVRSLKRKGEMEHEPVRSPAARARGRRGPQAG